MAYSKQNFKSGQVLTAAQMNHIEDGIIAEVTELKSDFTEHKDAKNPHGTTAKDVGALPIVGGTMSGNNIYMANGYSRFYGSNLETAMMSFDVAEDHTNRRSLELFNSYKPEIAEALLLCDRVNNVSTFYRLYGEHNKPSGSYYGDNTTNTRTINIGGVGDILVVTYEAHISFVHSKGAVCFYTDGRTDIQTYSASIVSFANGIFTTKTNSGFFNGGGCQYKWRLL